MPATRRDARIHSAPSRQSPVRLQALDVDNAPASLSPVDSTSPSCSQHAPLSVAQVQSTSHPATNSVPALPPRSPKWSLGRKVFVFPDAGKSLGTARTVFEVERDNRRSSQQLDYAPFRSQDEWITAKWIAESGLSQGSTDRLLKGPMAAYCRQSAPHLYGTFNDNKSYLKTIDTISGLQALWNLLEVTVKGDLCDSQGKPLHQTLDCWLQNPVDLVIELLGNPEFVNDLSFAPYREHMEDVAEELQNAESDQDWARVYEEMASAEWWERVQAKLSEHVPHATIAPVMLASDKTQLSTFSGDKQAWPVYLTIGNIYKSVRRQPSRRAVILLGYLPAEKLTCFSESKRALAAYQLFHYTMGKILEPLITAGRDGVRVTCADGHVRLVFPLLAAYIADHPEQALVCCTQENCCPTCTVERDRRGDFIDNPLREPTTMLDTLRDPDSKDFETWGLHDIPDPFWANLPYANIFNCIVPDLLHQLHKGVFKTHLVKWISKGHEAELDARFASVPPYPTLCVFSKGISKITQWTGNEFRQMEKVFVGIVDRLHKDPRIMVCTRAILNFIYLAHYPSRTVATLADMHRELTTFHNNKQAFVDIGAQAHFNIPKLHWASAHYIPSIFDFGSCDGLSTEISERLHIDYAKLAYRASNRKNYIRQMVLWLTRREKVRWFDGFLRWCRESDASVAAATTPAWSSGSQTTYPPPLNSQDLSPDEEPHYDDDAEGDDNLDDLLHAPSATEVDPAVRISSVLYSSGTQSDGIPHTEECSGSTASTTSIVDAPSHEAEAILQRSLTDSGDGAESDVDEDSEVSLFGPYKIARQATLGVLTGKSITAEFPAPHFAPALATFLRSEGFPSRYTTAETLSGHSFSMYKQFSRTLPSLRGAQDDVFRDTVYARPSSKQSPARYSAVLFVEHHDHAETIGVKGYRAGRICAIFNLPPKLQRLRTNATEPLAHLAYLELFTPFTDNPEPNSGLYKVKVSQVRMQ